MGPIAEGVTAIPLVELMRKFAWPPEHLGEFIGRNLRRTGSRTYARDGLRIRRRCVIPVFQQPLSVRRARAAVLHRAAVASYPAGASAASR